MSERRTRQTSRELADLRGCLDRDGVGREMLRSGRAMTAATPSGVHGKPKGWGMRALIWLLVMGCAALWLSAGVAHACHMSSQSRLFPLGVAKDRLVVLQIQAMRGGRAKINWTGEAFLRFASLDGTWRKKRRKIDAFKIDDRTYERDLRPVLAKAFAAARKLPGFQALAAPKLGFCRFRKRCRVGKSKLRFKVSPKGVLVLQGDRSKARSFTRQIALSQEVKARISRKMPGSFAKAVPSEKARWLREFGMGSYRLYQVGKRMLLVFTLAMGGRTVTAFNKQGKETKIDTRTTHQPRWKPCSSSKSCMPKAPALWHGLAFDTMLLLR